MTQNQQEQIEIVKNNQDLSFLLMQSESPVNITSSKRDYTSIFDVQKINQISPET